MMNQHLQTDHCSDLRPSRRQVVRGIASSFAGLACAALMDQSARGVDRDGAEGSGSGASRPQRAKRVIFLCMNGGPSHVDLFDYKPELNRRSGELMLGDKGPRLFGSPFSFRQHGNAGHWISELHPHLAKHADDLCFLHGMQTDLPNHSQAFLQMHTGSFQFDRPSFGAWTLYGLGTENENLPGFITLNPPSDNGGAKNYGSSFLPANFQGTRIGTNQIPRFYAKLMGVDQEPGPPLKNIGNARRSPAEQRRQLDLIRDLNQQKLRRDLQHPEIEGAIESFELAFRMQDEVPQLLKLDPESQSTLDAYGIGSGLPTDRFGQQCLMARRMAQAGVRFIELTSPVGWDHHFLLESALRESCEATDQPIAALLSDLKQTGLLEDTLVVWAGEFGRTPYVQSGTGRDHNHKGYTIWMAGGGVKAGSRHGETDEFGAQAVEGKVHIHDWHATLLHLLGLDHTKLTYRYAGRDYRLTDVYGEVVHEVVG